MIPVPEPDLEAIWGLKWEPNSHLIFIYKK